MSQAILTAYRTEKSYYTVNVRLLMGTVVAVLLATVLGYAWYQYRQAQATEAILARAQKLDKEEKWAEAAAYYQRYLLADPDNTEVLVQLIGVLNRGEPTPRKLHQLNDLLYRTLGRLPEREDLRLLLAENLLKTGSWTEAEAEAAKIADVSSEVTLKARKVIAVSKLRQVSIDNTNSANETLQELIEVAEELPADYELAFTTANAIRDQLKDPAAEYRDPQEIADRHKLADRLVDASVAANPNDIKARLGRYRYRISNSLPGIEDDLAAALEIDPDNTDALLISAVSKISGQSTAEDLNTANSELRRVIETTPEDSRAYLALVEVLKLQGLTPEAIRLLNDVVARIEDKFRLQLTLATLLLESNQISDAEATLERLQRDNTTYLASLDREHRIQLENQLRLLTARIAVAQGNSKEAISDLKTIYLGGDMAAAGDRRSPEWLQASQLLATIYQQQGAWDQASAYWNALVEVAPGNPVIAEAAAQSALRAGNGDRAAEIINNFARKATLTENLHVLRVQTLFFAEMRRFPEERNWREFDQAIEEALAHGKRPELLFAQIERLKAETFDKARVVELLREGEEQFGDNKEFWRRAVLQYAQLAAPADQKRALAHYNSLETSQVEKAIVEAAVLSQGKDFAAADKLLADLAATLPKEQQGNLQLRRIETLAQHNQVRKAAKLANDLLERDSSDPKLLRLGAELSLAVGDSVAAQRWEQKLAAIAANDNDTDARVLKAKRLLSNFAALSVKQRQELAELISGVRKERPEWVEIVSLAARFAELTGDRRRAAEDYRLAVALGDRREFTLQQLVTSLYGLSLFDEAERYLNILASNQSDSNFVNSMGIELAVKRGVSEGAIKAAHQSVEQSPQDASRRIYLANLLLAFGKRLEAEEVLRQAARDLPDDPQVWLGLVSYLVKDNRKSEATEIITTAELRESIGGNGRFLLLAQGYDLVGDYASAAKYYHAALESIQGNAQLHLQYARCLAKRSIQEALPEYERVLELEPANQEARNELAVVLASTGKPDDWTRANLLLEDDKSTSATASNARKLLRALLLSQQGRTRADRIAKCSAARKLLEKQIETLSGIEAVFSRLVLAQIMEQESDLRGDESLLNEARNHLQKVVNGERPTTEQRSRYIEFLLRNADKVDEKTEFLNVAAEQLEILQKNLRLDDIGNAALHAALSWQLNTALGNTAKAGEVVEEFVTQQSQEGPPNSAIPRLLAAGKLYAVAKKPAAAEKIYRQLFELTPNAYVLVVQSLLDQGKQREAAQFCLELGSDGLTPEVAQTLAAVLTKSEDMIALEFPEAEAALQAAVAKYSTNAELLQADAVRLASLGKYDEAIDAFRQVVKLDPRNSLALNNLATLLAERSTQLEESLQLVQQAIQFAGRQPSLLDTEGTILLKLRRSDEAIVSLEEATAGGVADARYYLHLAAAYQSAQRNEEALKMLDEATGFGLEKFLLTEGDRQILQDLNALKEKSISAVGTSI